MSKTKPEKVSPDLDTPTDLPRAAVNQIRRTWFPFEGRRQEGGNEA